MAKILEGESVMRVIERIKVITDDGTIHEINKWELAPIASDGSDGGVPSRESLHVYRTANGQGVTPQADGSFALRSGKLAHRLPEARLSASVNQIQHTDPKC
jgi:hypothetical protein